jgi:hypothetical protein
MVEELNRGDGEETSLAQPGRSSILRSPRRGRSDKGTMASTKRRSLRESASGVQLPGGRTGVVKQRNGVLH